jgi:tetratricopeptide (TPR) repeat protein
VSGRPSPSGDLAELAAVLETELSELPSGAERDERKARLVNVYLEALKTERRRAVRKNLADRVFSFHRTSPLDPRILEAIAETASARGDEDIQQHALEILSADGDPKVKTRALERLGDLYAELGDRKRAIDSWRPAAQIREENPKEAKEAQRLYERVLETLPDDREAAERLVRLYAKASDWQKIPEVLGVVIRADGERGAQLVLRLHNSAHKAKALDQFVTMVDEAAALRTPSSNIARDLRRAKARALAEIPERQSEASAAYRSLLESFGRDEDAREYQSLLESRPKNPEQRWERRWLYQWRAEHDERPLDALLEWAKDEEQAGETEEAATIYRSALDLTDEGERPALTLKTVAFFERSGRLDDALNCLAPLLVAVPRMQEAHDIARRMLADSKWEGRVARRLEELANGMRETDASAAVRLFEVLIDAPAENVGRDERRRWYRSAVDLSEHALGLALLVRGAVELPDETSLWEAAERSGREVGQLGAVVSAYAEVLTRPAADAVEVALADRLGRRMIALEGECAAPSSLFVDALEKVLERLPLARWALDRVKLAFGSQARWEDLFRLYDRAVAASSDDQERVELLHEAAVAARDVASDAERAIRYFASIRALRPGDATVASALARLYTRVGRKSDLIELLCDRAATLSGPERHDHQRRIAALWLELGKIEEANATLEATLADGAPVGDLTDLLERVASHRGHTQAIEHLCGYYESVGKIGEVVRLRKAALESTADAKQNARNVRELVRARVVALQGAAGMFGAVIDSLESDIATNRGLVKLAYRALLGRAISARKGAQTDAELEDVLTGAWRAIDVLSSTFLEAGDTRGAMRLLRRGARLPFGRGRQRELLHRTALLYSEPSDVGERTRAIRVFREIFEDQSDGLAANLVTRYIELLEAAGDDSKLASFFESQGAHQAKAGNATEASGWWLRAARVWESEEDWDRAIAAYERGAELGPDDLATCEESFEALARIHAMRAEWTKALAPLEWLCSHASEELRGPRTIRLADTLVVLGQTDRARVSLEEVLKDASLAVARDVRARLITLYRRDGNWRGLADTLEAEGALCEGEAKAKLLAEAAEVRAQKLAEPADAARLLELAVTSSPEDLNLRPLLADVLEELGHWERLAVVLADQTALYGERRSKERGLIHHRLATALTRTNRAADALEHLELAAKMHPTDPRILYDLAGASLAADKLDLAERTYRALLLAVRSPSNKAGPTFSYTRIFLDLAAIAVRKNDPEHAASLLESGLDAALENHEDERPLEEALRELGRHDLVARLLESRVLRLPEGSGRAASLRELVDLWTAHLGREPALATRLRRYAEEIVPTIEEEAWAELWSIHGALGNDPAQITMVRQRLDAPRRPSKSWLLEAASLCTRIEDYELAASVYAALAQEDPRAEDTWSGLEGVLGRLEQRERLVPILSSAVSSLPAGAERAQLYARMAKFVGERTRQIDSAIQLLASAFADDPADAEIASAFSDILEDEGRFGELAAMLERRLAALGEESAERSEIQWRLAHALERAGRLPAAASLFETLLDVRPIALERVRALAERLEVLRSARLADAIELWIALDETSPPALAAKLVSLRDVQHDPAGILRALSLAFAADPTDSGFRDRLVQTYEERKDLGAVTRVLRRFVDARPDDRAALRRLLEAYRTVGAEQDALEVLDRAIDRSPGDAELRCLRANLRVGLGDDEGAASDLRSVDAREAGQVDLVVEILSGILSRARPGETADSYAMLLVDVLVRADRPDQARGELESLFARDPRSAALAERIAAPEAVAGAWEKAADAYRRLLGILEEAGHAEPAALSRAVVALAAACEHAGHLDEAREPLERVLQALPGDEDVARSLEHVCESAGDSERLSELLASRADRTADGAEKSTLLVRAARLLVDGGEPIVAGDRGVAERVLALVDRARAANPESFGAGLFYGWLAMGLERPRDAITAFHGIIERSAGKRPKSLATVYLELAKAHLHHSLDELAEALDALKAGFAIDLRNGEMAMLLGLLAIDLGDEKTAERALLAVVTLARKEESSPELSTTAERLSFVPPAPSSSAVGEPRPSGSLPLDLGSERFLPGSAQAEISRPHHPTDALAALCHLAAMAYAHRDFVKARRWISKAIREEPTHPEALALLHRLDASEKGALRLR